MKYDIISSHRLISNEIKLNFEEEQNGQMHMWKENIYTKKRASNSVI